MNAMKHKLPVADFRLPIQAKSAERLCIPTGNRKLAIENAFTLIELLVVIAIIGILAAFLLPVIGAVQRHELINKTQAEMSQLETAIDSYRAAEGFYPPCNTNNPMINPLYYELLGTTNIALAGAPSPRYQSLDDPNLILVGGIGPAQQTARAFNLGGFMNCSKPGAGEDAQRARSFIQDLRPDQINKNITNNNVRVALLVASVGGPYQKYDPLHNFNLMASAPDVNPWRYVYPGTNNPNSYDLWVQLVLKPGQTDLVCNWSRQPQINSPLP
jgi:prepilin-type N-terminal cleavage/methylation domain-containing protein